MIDLDQRLFLFLNGGPDTPLMLVAVFRLISSSMLATLMALTAALSLWQRQRRPAVLAALGAVLATAVAVWLIRSTWPLPRPAAFGLGVQWLMQNAGRPGFPSAHTSTAFAFAAALLLARWRRAAIIAFLAASLIGYSRIFLGLHFPSQVLAGGLLGIALPSALMLLWNAIEQRAGKVWRHAGQPLNWRAVARRVPVRPDARRDTP